MSDDRAQFPAATIVADVRRVAEETGRVPDGPLYRDEGHIPFTDALRPYGTFDQLLVAAGFAPDHAGQLRGGTPDDAAVSATATSGATAEPTAVGQGGDD